MTRTWVRELAGWMLALAVALVTTASVAASARGDLLFRDGDSLIVALLSRSILEGDRLDWAMSSVLFLPETAVFTVLEAALPITVDALFAVSAIVNLLALYGAFRLVAGRRREGSAPVAWSVAALGALGALAMTETSASRDALELASLPLTTTYYSATVVAVVASVGIARRIRDGSAHRAALLVGLGLVAAVSTLSNPLYAVWLTAPLVVILAILALRSRTRTRDLWLVAALLAGTVAGAGFRIPFSAWIANTGAGYAQPALWMESVEYYGRLLAERLQSPLGLVAAVAVIALLALGILRTARARDDASRLVAIASWALPLAVVIGAVALGTHAARYLQPAVFAPLLALVADTRALRAPERIGRRITAVSAVALLVGGALSVPRLATAAATTDPDLACVTSWVDASERTGAGQFWTVRLPKLHLDDPSRLVQVDHRLDGYAWLVNRADLDAREVTFLVQDSQSVAWELPVSAVPDAIVECGRWTILDFASTPLPLGPAHS
ncbi:hypothetical protein [Microbacterium sp. NPDC089695]|uniref:hypothetical protein n=1 Tax=Microbacterium sp. NPDC089695 TaxID=3364198 RepID=UPI003830231E